DFGPAYDETRYARMIAEKFQTRHREIFVTPKEFQDFIPSLVWHMDEPVTESAAISLYYVAKLAREDVTVVLSGEGSDEVFGGYPIYKYMQTLERYRRLPAALRQNLINPALNLLGGKWNKYTRLSDRPLRERYLGVSFYETPVKEALYRPEIRNLFNGHGMPGLVQPYYEKAKGLDPLLQMMYLDVKSWLPDDLLVKADKMTMASGVELRVPFLDHRVVELGGRIPPRYRIKGWTTKYILKKAMEKHLPHEILHRGKMGFPTPLARMFQGEMRPYVAEVLGSDRHLGRGYFRPEVVRAMVSEHMEGKQDHHRVLWQLLVLEEWHRKFID
ncbi:MAG TPA: asparagine synthase C-terminal domain-containing protein, partial [Thermoanaerobaculia bacterium]|nr:asparagine synthase C-terminal domain-containing protein [Thermoanaerobaculia bacterium]